METIKVSKAGNSQDSSFSQRNAAPTRVALAVHQSQQNQQSTSISPSRIDQSSTSDPNQTKHKPNIDPTKITNSVQTQTITSSTHQPTASTSLSEKIDEIQSRLKSGEGVCQVNDYSYVITLSSGETIWYATEDAIRFEAVHNSRNTCRRIIKSKL